MRACLQEDASDLVQHVRSDDVLLQPALRRRKRFLRRVVAEHVLRGVTRHSPHQEEGDRDDSEQRYNELNEATTEIVEHISPFLRQRDRIGLHRK